MPEQTSGTVRALLSEERDRLRERLHELRPTADSELTFDDGFADTSQVTAERGEIEALTSSLSESLHEVEDALAKVEAGTYGSCESCSKPIAEARLEAKPAARLCIACASKTR